MRLPTHRQHAWKACVLGRRGGEGLCLILTSATHITYSQLPGILHWNLITQVTNFLVGSCHIPKLSDFSFPYWYNGNYMTENNLQLYNGKELMFFKHREILQMWLKVLDIMGTTYIYYALQRERNITQVLITSIESLNLQCGYIISAKKN